MGADEQKIERPNCSFFSVQPRCSLCLCGGGLPLTAETENAEVAQ